jgi:Fe(3+) dicitrate transport protein
MSRCTPFVPFALVALLGALPGGAGAEEAPPAAPDGGVAGPEAEALDSAYVEEVVVTAPPLDLSRVAGSAASVGEQELDRYEHGDVHRVLEKVPGVYVRGEDGFGLRPNIGLRGVPADRSSKVVLMEDGVPLAPAPYSAPAAYYFPVVNRLVGVEVYKGPAAIRFGPHTVGGAVDLRTRVVPEDTLGGVVDVAGGLDLYGRAHGAVGYGTGRWGLLVEGVRLQTRGFKELDGGGDTGFEKNELVIKGRLDPSGSAREGRLELQLGLATERSSETYLGLTDADFLQRPFRRYAASRLDQMDWMRTQARLRYSGELAPSLSLEVVGYRHDFDRAWRKVNRFRGGPELSAVLAQPDLGQTAVYAAVLRGDEDSQGPDQALMIGTNDRAFVSQGVQGKLTFRADGEWSHLVQAGVRLHHDQVERLHTEDAFLMQAMTLVPEGTDRLTTASNRAAATALALFAIDEVLWGRWLWTPGVRVELIGTRFDDALGGARTDGFQWAVLPGVGGLYHLEGGWSVLAGVHRGFSPSSPGPIAASPELSVSYEAGARYRASGSHAELIGFFNDYSNLTRDCSMAAGCSEEQLQQQFEAGRVHVYGLEAVVEQAFSLPAQTELRLKGAYTLTGSRFLTSFFSDNPQLGEVEAGDELPGVPLHQASLAVAAEGPIWSAGLSASFTGEVRERAGQGPIPEADRIGAHLVLDLSASWRPVAGGEAYLVVENLLNARYLASRRPFGARPGRPLFAQVGYRHRF